jgi:hypothetical protein
MTTHYKIPVDTRDAEQIDEEQAAAETAAHLKFSALAAAEMAQANRRLNTPTFGESPAGVALLCVLGALDCVMARLRVDQAELQEAVTRKFEQAGVKMPDGLVETSNE